MTARNDAWGCLAGTAAKPLNKGRHKTVSEPARLDPDHMARLDDHEERLAWLEAVCDTSDRLDRIDRLIERLERLGLPGAAGF